MDDKLTRKERKARAAAKRIRFQHEILDALTQELASGSSFVQALEFADRAIATTIQKNPQQKAEIVRAARELSEVLNQHIQAHIRKQEAERDGR
jgi:hypothetical protein